MKLIQWIKGPKSDFLLFILLIILINLVSTRAFFRIDATKTQSFSLSESSEQLVQNLEEPLSVKVFFSENLPSPYNTTHQYVTDLLTEYSGNANSNFSWEAYDMENPENEEIARNYRLNQVQIQEINNNEVGFKNVWMGLVLTYADRIEVIDGISTSDGLEYRLTTTMSSMINSVSSLAGLSGNVSLTLYVTPELANFNIQGFSDIEPTVLNAYSNLNAKHSGKILYETVNPDIEDIPSIVETYGIQQLDWEDENGELGTGTLGLVLSYEENFRVIPLEMASQLFFGNIIAGLDTLEENLTNSLDSLVSKSTTIGYVTGHGEVSITDSQVGSALLANLVSDRYTFEELNLLEVDIPSSVSTLVINGPKTAFTDEELYKIDQFVLRGGNLSLFIDPFNAVQDEMAAMYGQQMPAQFVPIDTGLQKLLSSYGIEVSTEYVLDTASFSEQNPQFGELNYYYIPLVHQNAMNENSAISQNLSFVFFPQTAPIEVTAEEENKVTVLASTSNEAWTMSENVDLNPLYMSPPTNPEEQSTKNLAVLVEGSFKSAYTQKPQSETDNEAQDTALLANTHISQSVQEAKIIVAGTSQITTPMVIDQEGSSPNAMFVQNILDYLNGNEDLARMRTRGISLNVLTVQDPVIAQFFQLFNQYMLPLLVVVAGLIVWKTRSNRRKRIFELYNGKQKEKDV